MEWSNDLVLEFIQIYEKYPVIWDPKNKQHKNRNDLADAWASIQKQLSGGFPVEALKKKKESLMATYRILKKKVSNSTRSGAGTKDKYKPTWFAYEAMNRFLRRTKRANSTLSTEGGKSTEPEEAIFNESINDNDRGTGLSMDVVYEEDVPEYYEPDTAKEFLSPKQGQENRKRRKNVDDEIQKRMKQAADVLQILQNLPLHQEEKKDECELYSQLLASKLRNLSAKTRIIVTNKIDNMIFEAEMQEMSSSLETEAQLT